MLSPPHTSAFKLVSWLLACACSFGANEPSDFHLDEPSKCAAEALSGGSLVAPELYPFVVAVETDDGTACTAVLVAPDALLLARHCVQPELDSVWIRSVSFCGSLSSCGPFAVRSVRHETADLAVLRVLDVAASPEVPTVPILLDEDFSQFLFLGYGAGSYTIGTEFCSTTPGERLIGGDFAVTWSDDGYFGSTVDGPAVCDGDSGGPALTFMDDRPHVAGLLVQSEASDAGPCTPAGGFQFWLRLARHWGWLRQSVGLCAEWELNGRRLGRCGALPGQ